MRVKFVKIVNNFLCLCKIFLNSVKLKNKTTIHRCPGLILCLFGVYLERSGFEAFFKRISALSRNDSEISLGSKSFDYRTKFEKYCQKKNGPLRLDG